MAFNLSEILVNIGYEVAGIANIAKDSLKFLEETSVDLVLMDILIKGDVDGIDLAYLIREKYEIPIVFSTAYSGTEFLERISSDIHEGYLLKPFTLDSLKTAIFFGLKRHQEKVSKLQKHVGSLKVMDKGFLVPIPFNEILFLKADGLYTKVVTKVKSYVVRDILKFFDDKLPKDQFMRVHKSFLINFHQVSSFNAKKINIGEFVIPLRRGLFKELKDKIHME